MTATVSSHLLNSVDGSHAAGVAVRLINLSSGETLFETATDSAGRLLQKIADPDTTARFEMVFHTGPYWQIRAGQTHGARIMDEIVLRFAMPDSAGRYHMPLILSPHGYALWSSTEHG
jgi:5-hydroxyisourate hydrolase